MAFPSETAGFVFDTSERLKLAWHGHFFLSFSITLLHWPERGNEIIAFLISYLISDVTRREISFLIESVKQATNVDPFFHPLFLSIFFSSSVTRSTADFCLCNEIILYTPWHFTSEGLLSFLRRSWNMAPEIYSAAVHRPVEVLVSKLRRRWAEPQYVRTTDCWRLCTS